MQTPPPQRKRSLSQTKRLRSIARRHIRALTAAEGNRCHWCRATIVLIEAVGPMVLRIDADRVYWRDEHGNDWAALYATIDHVIPLSEYPPGPPFKHRYPPSHPLNLVASCAPCNRRRGLDPLWPMSDAG